MFACMVYMVMGHYGFHGNRLLVLGKLNELMKKWIVEVSIEKVGTN